jgi:hypothetical protein
MCLECCAKRRTNKHKESPTFQEGALEKTTNPSGQRRSTFSHAVSRGVARECGLECIWVPEALPRIRLIQRHMLVASQGFHVYEIHVLVHF